MEAAERKQDRDTQKVGNQPKMYPLRLSRTMRLEPPELARREGISLNQFIVQAVAETVNRLNNKRR